MTKGEVTTQSDLVAEHLSVTGSPIYNTDPRVKLWPRLCVYIPDFGGFLFRRPLVLKLDTCVPSSKVDKDEHDETRDRRLLD